MQAIWKTAKRRPRPLRFGAMLAAMAVLTAPTPASSKEGHSAQTATAAEPLAVFADALQGGGTGPEMVVIPAGRFRMGCLPGGKICYGAEKPVHEVTIATFALAKHEVTFEDYDRFTAATGRPEQGDRGWGRGRHPAMEMSWRDAVTYTEWLSVQTGARYRLPSEAEWEYAARAGTTTLFHFGDDPGQLCTWGNVADRTFKKSHWAMRILNLVRVVPVLKCADGHAFSAPAGSFGANAWGLYDTHGNVMEWTLDCWNQSYEGAPTDGAAWTSGNCERRVARGGSFVDKPKHLRAAVRSWWTGPDRRIGLRLARALP